jgi:hypothetical protein
VSEAETLGRIAEVAWAWLEETVADVRATEANWWPPGTANSIGATYLHVIINADLELSWWLFDRTAVADAIGWPYDLEHYDRWVRHADVDWSALRDYGRAVAATIGTPSVADLERPVDMTRVGLGMWRGRDLYELHGFNHVYIHGGEIAVLKGLQGGVGYNEPDEFRAAIDIIDLEP